MKPIFVRTLLLSAVLAVLCGAIPALAQVVSVTGYVYDGITREAVNDVKVTFLDADGGSKPNTSVSHSGGYYLVTGLKPGKKYRIRIEKPNYFQVEHDFQAPNTGKYAEISRDFLVYSMRKGVRLPLSVSPFFPKKSKIRVGSEEIMDELVGLMAMNPNVNIEIVSYPDNDDDKRENSQLTTERAKAIRDYLVSKGISDTRVKTTAKSEVDPLNPLPMRKQAKGKQYIGMVYIVVTQA